jgi:hypothetical protein
MRACPLCGDPGWDYVNGMNDRDGMACGISCGYTWTADDPGWRAQVPTRRAALTAIRTVDTGNDPRWLQESSKMVRR